MKHWILLVVAGLAFAAVGHLGFEDDVALQGHHCEMIILHEETKHTHSGYDMMGYPAQDEQEVKFCREFLKQQGLAK